MVELIITNLSSMIVCPIQNKALYIGNWIQRRPIINQGFGLNPQNYPSSQGKGHGGIDYGGKTGDHVFAPIRGTVLVKDDGQKAFGLHVRIRNKYGLEVILAHLSKVDVKNGQEVYQLDKIGEVGSTGNSTGPHLHYALRFLVVNEKEKDIFKWNVKPSEFHPYGYIDPLPVTVNWKGTELQNTL